MQLDHHLPHIIADIPGLIEGAHEGAGLGHRFLKHIERTKVLLHILDASKTIEEILEDRQTIEKELSKFNESLLSRRKLILLNKIDLLDDEKQLDKLKAIFIKKKIPVLFISALADVGIYDLLVDLFETLES